MLLLLVFVGVLAGLLGGYLWWRESQLVYRMGADFPDSQRVQFYGLALYALLQWIKFGVLAALTLLIASFSNTNLFTVVIAFFAQLVCQLQYIAQDSWQKVEAPAAQVLRPSRPRECRLPWARLFWKSIQEFRPTLTIKSGAREPTSIALRGFATSRVSNRHNDRTSRYRAGQGRRIRRDRFSPRRRFLTMRGMFFTTLSQVLEFGIFAAAAGALAIGMMNLR